MPDIKACDLTEPHRRHNWQESKPYNGFVPHMIPLYHVCPGVARSEEDHDRSRAREDSGYRLVGVDLEAVQRRYEEVLGAIHGQDPSRTYTVSEVRDLIRPLDPRPAREETR